MLINASKRATVESLATRITHIELETNPNFFNHIVEGCQFKRLNVTVISYAHNRIFPTRRLMP